ncbi:MAG: hypothetical protein QM757_34230 [Paludibaculum sp.]
MKRRTFLGTTAAVAAPVPTKMVSKKNGVVLKTRRLKLKHTWTTVMSSSDYRDTFYVEFTNGGVTGIGEGAPIIRYKESAETCTAALEAIRPWLESADPWQFAKFMQTAFQKIEGNWAGKAALDIALLDWVGKKLNIPLWRHFGLDRNDAPVTTFSIGIDKAEVVRQKVLEADPFPVLKVKVGLANDEEMIASYAAVTKKPLRVDANEEVLFGFYRVSLLTLAIRN